MSWFDRVRPNRKSDESWALSAPWIGQSPPSWLAGNDVRDGLDSNVVMAPVAWIMRTFTEAEPTVQVKRDGMWRLFEEHGMTMAVENPNNFYDGDALWKATVISYCLEGDAYWYKVRSGLGTVMELWYIPHWMIEPSWTEGSTTFIDHYVYKPENRRIRVENIVHFRFGLDPRNTRKGFSPLRPLLREVFTDEEASIFSATILRNMGVPGLIVSPKDATASVTPAKAAETKERLIAHFTRDRRGEPFVATGPTDVKQFGFDPNQLMLGNLRDIAEERVCAMLGVPAAVVGFGAGLQQTKVGATMRENVRLARVNAINPMARTFGKVLDKQLLPDFQSQMRRFRVRFDMSEVSVFQEDEKEREERIRENVMAGVLRVDKAQEQLGIEVDASQSIYLRESSLRAVPANKTPIFEPEEPQPREPGNRIPADVDGNGAD